MILLYKNLQKQNLSDYQIKKKLQDKTLYLVAKGVYSTEEKYDPLEVLVKKHPNVILTLETACICYSLIKNVNCNVVKGSLEFLPFEDKYFDKVIILDHFNHTTDSERVISEINRVLKVNGEVILEDLNLKNIKVKLKNLKHKLCGENINYHYPNEIIDLFSKVNIKGIMKEIENERYIYIGKRNR